MSKILAVKIDVSKIEKEKLYEGKKGTYLDAVLFLNDEDDKFGNNGMIVQSASKEERDKGIKGAILGNSSEIKKKEQTTKTEESEESEEQDDLPF